MMSDVFKKRDDERINDHLIHTMDRMMIPLALDYAPILFDQLIVCIDDAPEAAHLTFSISTR